MKKKLIVLFFLIGWIFSTGAIAQQGKLPPFQMVQPNGKIFKAQYLPMGKPIVIIYFSPDCDHCEKLMKEVLKHKTELKKASIAMVTHLPVQNVTAFVKKYKLNNETNFYVGTEGTTFFLKNYYKLVEMPFMALYTKNGDLVKTFEHDGDLGDLVNKLRALQ
jgi:thioredoxin-related protein